MWLISSPVQKELIQIAEYFRTPLATAVTGGDRISNSESPLPAVVMITPKAGGSE